jgi:hypothetical protein
VNATIKKELGKDPSELFEHFDTTALATASVGILVSFFLFLIETMGTSWLSLVVVTLIGN